MGVELKGLSIPLSQSRLTLHFNPKPLLYWLEKAVRVNQPFFKLLPNSVQCHIVVRSLSMELT